MTSDQTQTSPAAVVLHDARMLRGSILVIGNQALETTQWLQSEGIEAKAALTEPERWKQAKKEGVPFIKVTEKFLKIPKGFDAILDLGLVALAKPSSRKKVISQLLEPLPAAGTLFIAGMSRTGKDSVFTPSAIKAAIDNKSVLLFPAMNYRDETQGKSAKGIIVPVQKLTRIPKSSELATATKPIPKLKKKAATQILSIGASTPSLVQNQHIMDPKPIVALQKCDSWCWAAGLQMLCKSQGIDVDQEVFVKKIFGVNSEGQPPCVMSGPWANIKKAIDGTVGTVNGKTITLTSDVIEGIPQGPNVRELVKNIQANEPFLFGYEAHILVCYGATWIERADQTGPIQITRLELIDPFPTSQRLTFITFPTTPFILSKILGVLLLSVKT